MESLRRGRYRRRGRRQYLRRLESGHYDDRAAASADPPPTPTRTPTPTPNTVQFVLAAQTVAEGLEQNTDPASLNVLVSRLGDTSAAASVDFQTSSVDETQRCDTNTGNASQRCDYETAIGTLRFAAGETQQTISIFITDDGHLESAETFQVTLMNPVGVGLGTPSTTTITIIDNDASPATTDSVLKLCC